MPCTCHPWGTPTPCADVEAVLQTRPTENKDFNFRDVSIKKKFERFLLTRMLALCAEGIMPTAMLALCAEASTRKDLMPMDGHERDSHTSRTDNAIAISTQCVELSDCHREAMTEHSGSSWESDIWWRILGTSIGTLTFSLLYGAINIVTGLISSIKDILFQ